MVAFSLQNVDSSISEILAVPSEYPAVQVSEEYVLE